MFYERKKKTYREEIELLLFPCLVTLSVAFATAPLQHILFFIHFFKISDATYIRISPGISEPVTMVVNELAALIVERRKYVC